MPIRGLCRASKSGGNFYRIGFDQLFQQAVALIGAGDVPALGRLLTDHPDLARERLAAPGPWLRDKTGGALAGLASVAMGRV